MDNFSGLKQIGLTTNEIKCYYYLIAVENDIATNISKKTNLHRRATYDALNRLIEKGLVSHFSKGNKKYFIATNPQKIKHILEEYNNNIDTEISALEEKYKVKKTNIFSETYEGKEGIKAIFDDIINTGKEWLTIGSSGNAPDLYPIYLDIFNKKRINKKIHRKVLVTPTETGKKYYKKLITEKFVSVKYLPKTFTNPQTVWIYGDKVVLKLVSKENIIAFMIHSKEMAQTHRDYFYALWNSKSKK
ncbi:MAG: helix-turn-helix domain-containing protein [Candidatus ainarchaeum sp.]|nr:helix-turn-helix domain-containing protein [Candidatus ainarchaeum sp.]